MSALRASTPMSGDAHSARTSETAQIEAAVRDVCASAERFARVPPAERAALLRACLPLIRDAAPRWVEAACQAKGIEPGTPLEGEDWLSGPMVTLRNARLLAESLEAIARDGKPPLGTGQRTRPDGRLEVSVFPTSRMESALWPGYSGSVLYEPGVTAAEARERQAPLYASGRPQARVTAILGAGNVSSIPPTDVFHKLFVDGSVCVLKMNPVNDYVGPVLEDALRPLIDPGYLRIVYGGAEAGAALVAHPDVHDIHVTGSAETYDRIVWGPPGEARERRKREGKPVLQKTISAELGNVSPVVIVPARYSPKELMFLARSVAAMVTNNASFNCNAGKLLVVSSDWPQREEFAGRLGRALAEAAPRKAYYPGAFDRFEDLLGGRANVERVGSAAGGELPWALVRDLNPEDRDERLFQVEPFCGIVSETALPESEPAAFLRAAVGFSNERVWGTLNATVFTHPSLSKDGAYAAELETSIAGLRYGTVGVNVWPALSFAVASVPWGGHGSARPEDIQSGLGWVHNPFMLEGFEKSVVRGPSTPMVKPAWHNDHSRTHELAPRLIDFEASPSWLKIPGLASIAIRG